MSKKLNYGLLAPDGEISGRFSVDMENVPSEDPLAYMHGFAQAYAGKDLTLLEEDLVPEYVKGYRHGTCVNKGVEPMPLWLSEDNDV